MNKNEELACEIASLFTQCYDVRLSKKALEKLAGYAETYTKEEMVVTQESSKSDSVKVMQQCRLYLN